MDSLIVRERLVPSFHLKMFSSFLICTQETSCFSLLQLYPHASIMVLETWQLQKKNIFSSSTSSSKI